MKMQMFSVYDTKTAAYFSPIYFNTVGQAVRVFEDSVADPEHIFNRHAEDFNLFHIGSFNDSDCSFDLLAVQIPLGNALEVLAALKNKPTAERSLDDPFPALKESNSQ